MKRVFALFLICLLVVACFSGCGEKEYEFNYDEFTSVQHSLGDLKNADVGIYPVKYVTRNESGKIKAIIPGTVSIKIVKDEIVNGKELAEKRATFLRENGTEIITKILYD